MLTCSHSLQGKGAEKKMVTEVREDEKKNWLTRRALIYSANKKNNPQ